MTVIVILAVLAFIAAIWYGVPALVSVRERRQLRRRCAGTLVLTYDDGPGPSLTARLLELLEEDGAGATFFLLGERAAERPDMADRVRAAGHEIGAHTHAHIHAWRAWPWSGLRDLTNGYRDLEPWVGPRALFRPAFGKLTLATLLALRRRGAKTAWWTHDGGDTFERWVPDPTRVVERVRRSGGGVVLLHDFDRAPARGAYVLAVTRLLLALARREQWQVRTLGQVLGAGVDRP